MMFEDAQLKKATLLYQHKRYSEAEKEYGALVTGNPADGYFHSMLALCTLYQDKKKEAEHHAKEGMHLSPSEGFSFYVAAVVAFSSNETKKAESFIYSALTLDPYQPDHHELKALILLHLKEWQKALDAANDGLAINAEHIGCLNARAKAYIKLDNKEQAYHTINEALYFDPENAHTHANLGWGLLEKNEHKKALEHFKQALAIDAGNDHARAGMIEALKARYFFYRLFLRYAFWIGNLKGKAQWAIIIGFYMGSRALEAIGDSNPHLRFITVPIVVLYTVFALTTWIITPLSNLFLRLNVYGRYALDKDEITSSNYIGISLLISLLSGVSFLFFHNPALLMLSVLGLTMTIPISGAFASIEGSKARRTLGIYAIAMLVTGLLSILYYFTSLEPFNILTGIFMLGFILYQWVANFLLTRVK